MDGDDERSIPTANVASAVHIDTDAGAYDSIDEFLAIVEKNQVKRQGTGDSKKFDIIKFKRKMSKNRKRFAKVNFWRNTNRREPVTTSPLVILSTRYKHGSDITTNVGKESTKNKKIAVSCQISAFPNSRRDLEQSKWYTFPNMTSDEVLVFYQYDRSVTQPSDLWHFAISIEDNRAQHAEAISKKSPRESFGILALVVFDEIVDKDKDRFHPVRLRPVLSFEESGCFCDEQAEKRSR